MSGRNRMTRPKRATRGKARGVIERPPLPQGWQTSDQEEIERRRWRGQSEITEVEPLEREQAYFGTFRVRSTSGTDYLVEIRDLEAHENSCACHDFAVNGLGTCKHIEGVLHHLSRRGKRAFKAAARQGSPRFEVYAAPGEPRLRVAGPRSAAGAEITPLLAPLEQAEADPEAVVAGLRSALADFSAEAARGVRLSCHLDDWLEGRRRKREDVAARESFEAKVEAGNASLDPVQLPMLPYQKEGMLHLAFGRRALLADEMGLGKTVQAIAACELLRRERGIERVLVVSPASLKAEWDEQIGKFTGLSVAVVQGTRADRLKAYRRPAFFNLTNYEQILSDARDINERLRPDVVILDEAQRIKNWQTKTARAVKTLASPYAFVLTGTPLENRIDEVYSIVQFLDPGLLGPLFRFNREFYELDDRGRPVGYRNLDELNRRLGRVMLRRRKADVEDQLPERSTKTYFVEMTGEQALRYQGYERRVAQLLQQMNRRPLTRQEMELLQLWLACMRMLCDTPYILDHECRDCPKLEELERLLVELLADPERKVIVFSEWERMLGLVRELAQAMGLEHAWHTGSVPQHRRRAEINRFKRDPGCRLFLSTDSGSVGLNLQAADTVINLDLPWNPAKLEQRIARAWRKHQTRRVRVLNLVSEQTIEHRMIALLAQKQALADGVLDGRGELTAIKLPSGRAAFLERLQSLMAAPPRERDLAEALCEQLLEERGDALLLVQARRDAAGFEGLLVVVESDAAAARQALDAGIEATCRAGETPPQVEVLDRDTWETIARLVDSGNLQFAAQGRELHRAGALDRRESDEWRERRRRARELLDQADRKCRMAALLANGGFAEEALQPLAEGEALTLRATAALDGDDAAEAAAAEAGAADARSAESLPDGLAAAARTIGAARARLAAGEARAAA